MENDDETIVSMQNIYESIFVDVREALCGCRNCERSQPVRPTFDAELKYVAREEDVATLFLYCRHLVPIHFVSVKLTTALLRSRGMVIKDIKHRLEFPVEALSQELRTQFPSDRDVVFDARVFDVIRKIMHESSSETYENLPVGLTSLTPVDYFHDLRPHLVIYAEILAATHAAIAGVKLGNIRARVEFVNVPAEPTTLEPEPASAAAPGVVADPMDALADLIRELELEEAAKKKPKPSKGGNKSVSKKTLHGPVPPPSPTRAEAIPERLCAVCMDAHVAVMINACGHVVLCEDCYDRTDMKHCPLCQGGQSCAGTVVWPQADERPPVCKKCTAMFPMNRCVCNVMTCGACGPCRCKRGKHATPHKLFWV